MRSERFERLKREFEVAAKRWPSATLEERVLLIHKTRKVAIEAGQLVDEAQREFRQTVLVLGLTPFKTGRGRR